MEIIEVSVVYNVLDWFWKFRIFCPCQCLMDLASDVLGIFDACHSFMNLKLVNCCFVHLEQNAYATKGVCNANLGTMYVYIYIYTYVKMHICIDIYVYIDR